MGGSRDDDEVLVVRGDAVGQLLVGALAQVSRVRLLPVHHHDGVLDLPDVVQEAHVGVGLRPDGGPALGGVEGARVEASLGLVVGVVVLDELRCVIRQRVHDPAGARSLTAPGHLAALGGQSRAGLVAGGGVVGRIEVAVACDPGHVVHGRGQGRLDPRVGRSRVQGDPAPAADTDDADALGVDVLARAEVVDGGHDVLGVDVRRGGVAGQARGLAGEGRVEGDREEAALGHGLGAHPGGLLLDGAEGPGHREGGEGTGLARGTVEVGGQGEAVAGGEGDLLVVDGVGEREGLVPLGGQGEVLGRHDSVVESKPDFRSRNMKE